MGFAAALRTAVAPVVADERDPLIRHALDQLISMRASNTLNKKSRRTRWSDVDRLVEKAHEHEREPLPDWALDRICHAAAFDRFIATSTPSDWVHGHYRLTMHGTARLGQILGIALQQRAAAMGGLGSRPTGSIESTWLLMNRFSLQRFELGWVLAAADEADPHAAIDRLRPRDRRRGLEISTAADQRQDFVRRIDKRYERLKKAGITTTRNPTE